MQNTYTKSFLKEDDFNSTISSLKQDLVAKNDLVAKLCEQYEILDIVSELTSDYFFQLSLCNDSLKAELFYG